MKTAQRMHRRIGLICFIELICLIGGAVASAQLVPAAPGNPVRITEVLRLPNSALQIGHSTGTEFYYVLLRGEDAARIRHVVDMRLADVPTLVDLRPPAEQAFYVIQQVPVSTPLDWDGDGIDDRYELQHSTFLDPLNGADAALDFDHDGRSNLQEYHGGTDPTRATAAPPATPVLTRLPTAVQATSLALSGSAQPGVVVQVDGGAAPVTGMAGPTGSFSLNVPLGSNRLNRLLVTAVDSQNQSSPPAMAEVIQDSQAPDLFVDFPGDNVSTDGAETTVAGRVGDMLGGFLGLKVWVHSAPSEGAPPNSPPTAPDAALRAVVDVGIGNNGTFVRQHVPLALGVNTVTAIATDVLGNVIIRQIQVTRQEAALNVSRMVRVSGDGQVTSVHQRLPEPIVVQLLQPGGAPLTNQLVTFEVIRSDGRLLPVTNVGALTNQIANDPARNTNGVMLLQLFSDSDGKARCWWAVGANAGCGNNRVRVASRGLAVPVFFCASAQPGGASQINIGSGNNQKAEINSPAPESLRIWVSDSCNGMGQFPVTFTVVQGGGKVRAAPLDLGPGSVGTVPPDWSDAVTLLTDATGHAVVELLLGPKPGQNVVEASFRDSPQLTQTFVVYEVKRDLSQPTSFTGLILDNSNHPIGGATCTLMVQNYQQSVLSSPDGHFRFERPPPGPARLFIDGQTATTLSSNTIPAGFFPSLQYSATVVPNTENSLPTPVLLPCLNVNNAILYSGTNDLVLTCEGMAGLKMTIKANSMRHPDGSVVRPQNPVLVSLNQVQHDKVPMPMPDGASPSFAWTLQPGGAHFDPPVEIQYPNMAGLPAGSVAYFLSYNHATERFEIVGSGHVDGAGALIETDPGSGISTAGWGCNCPPYSATGSCQACVLKISGPSLVEQSKTITLTTTKKPIDWSFEPITAGASVTLEPHEDSVKVTGTAEGVVRIIAKWRDQNTDETCHGEARVHIGECGEEAVPDPGPFTLQAGGWSMNGSVSPDNGVIVTGVRVGQHYLADQMGVPYVTARVRLSSGNVVEQVVALRPNSSSATWRSRLVGFHKNTSATRANVTAKYLIDRIPDDTTKAKLCVIQRYAFTKFDPDDHCNPFAATCSRFYPITQYEFYDDPDAGVSLDKVSIVQAIHFAIEGQPSNVGTFTTETVPPVAPVGGNPLSKERSFLAIAAGQLGRVDNYHQTYLSSIALPTPFDPTAGCHECLHMHWRWSAIASVLGAAFGAAFGGFDANGGAPMIPPDSQQSVRIGLTAYHSPNDYQTRDWEQEIDNEFLDLGQPILFWYEGTSSAASDSFFNHGGFFVQEEAMPQSLASISSSQRANLAGVNSPPRVQLDPDSPLNLLVPKRYGALDESWLLSVNGQTVQADPDGGFRIPNVSAPDLFGVEGPGSIPDFISDDPVRITGVSTKNGVNRYVQSPFFRITQGASIALSDLTFSMTPPLAPESLRSAATLATMTKLGQQSQITVTGFFSDGSQKDLTALAKGTSYRTSNPQIANVSPDGLITATGRGSAYLTAINQGATTVISVDVVPGDPLTTVIGLVQDESGKPVAGAEVTLTALAARGVTGVDGRFVITDVPTTFPGISVTAQWVNQSQREIGTSENVQLMPDRITDVGSITIRPAQTGLNRFKIATGDNHTLVVETDGSLWAWGANANGQLGNGTTLTQTRPVRVGTDNNWSAVAAGSFHSLAVKTGGTLWAWGDNFSGELGDGTVRNSKSAPIQIGLEKNWAAVAAGEGHSLAVKTDGTLWSWGGNRQGQLGDGTQNPVTTPAQIGSDTDWSNVSATQEYSAALKRNGTFWIWGDAPAIPGRSPLQVGNDHDWIDLAAGRYHVVLVKADGSLWVIGRFRTLDAAGKEVNDSNVPVRLGAENDWVAVAAGDDTSFALKKDGTLWAAGANQVGQLGDGTIRDQLTPVPIAPGQRWRAFAAKSNHTVVLSTDGAYYAWGWNSDGQLGVGFIGNNQVTPKQISTDTDWRTVAISQYDMLAIKTSGALWGWGGNFYGELGDATRLSRSNPVRIGDDTDWSSVAFGSRHTLGLKRGGTLWAWGGNVVNQLGASTPTESLIPLRIGVDSDWVAISAAAFHSFAVKANGTLWGWGENFSGQLGDGTTQARTVPTQIGSDRDWTAIAAAGDHALARKTDGSLWAWGQNQGGQLGIGTTTASVIPVRIGTDLDWSALFAASELYSVALKSSGSLWQWGIIGWQTTPLKSPTQLGNMTGWQSFGLGTAHLMLVDRDGNLWGIGANSWGNLGDGTTVEKKSLTQIDASKNWRFVTAGGSEGGYSVSAGIKTDGTLWTWGSTEVGRLGDPGQFVPRRVGNAGEWAPRP